MLDGMRALLAPYYEISGTVADGRDVVHMALRLKPDLIVMDVAMPLLNGVDAAIQIRQSLPEILLVFVTMHSSSATIKAAFEAGATGYVLKSGGIKELPIAVESVLSGRVYVSLSASTQHLKRHQDPEGGAVHNLSMRERETLQLIAEGKAAKEIAYIMGISPKTIAFHRSNLRKKLGVRSTAELTKRAIKLTLIQ